MPTNNSPKNYYCMNCGYIQPARKGNQCLKCKKVGEELVIFEKTNRRFKYSKIVELIIFLSLLALTGFSLITLGLIYEEGLNSIFF